MHLTLHQTSQIEPETGRIQTPKQVKKVIWERKLHKSASNCMFWEGFPFRHVIRNDIFSNHVRITWVRITAVTQNSSHRGFSSHRGHQKSSKIIKSDPMATQKHQKCALKSLEFQLLWKVGFCNPSHTKCLVLNPILKKKVQTRIRKSDFLFSGNSSSIFLKYFSKKSWILHFGIIIWKTFRLFDNDILLFDGRMFLFDGNTRAGAWPKSLRDPSSHIQSHTKLSQGHQNTSILDPRFNRIPTSAKNWFLQHLSHQMLVSGAPDVQIQTLKSFKKVTWKSARTKNMYVDPRSPKSYENGVPKTKRNRKNTKPGPQDLFSNAPRYPWIVPWSPRVQNGGRRHTRK